MCVHGALFDKARGGASRKPSHAETVRADDHPARQPAQFREPRDPAAVTPSGRTGIRAVEEALARPRFATLLRRDAPSGDLTLAELVHGPRLSRARCAHARPAEGIGQIDEDTFISSGSLDAASTALGGGAGGARRGGAGRSRQRLLRHPPARPPCRDRDADGLLPRQHHRRRRARGAAQIRRRAGRDRRFRRPPRQRHAGHLQGRPDGVLRLEPPDAALSRHRRAERDRRRQHRQRAARAGQRRRRDARGL